MPERVLNDLLGDLASVFPGSMPQAERYPAVVYRRTGTDRPADGLHGCGGLIRARIELACMARSYTAAKNLARDVRYRLHNFTGQVDDIVVRGVTISDESDLARSAADGSDDWVYGVLLDVNLWADELVPPYTE